MPSATQPEFLPGTLHLLILRSLSAGPLHGYAIAKRIKDVSQSALAVEEGSLYPALNRMLVKGWLTAKWGISENNRKARFYQLTKAGLQQLGRETAEFDRLVSAIQLVLREA
ncbi:MAG: PadR family transcriptional regulator [Bryobacteraceae bacterium]